MHVFMFSFPIAPYTFSFIIIFFFICLFINYCYLLLQNRFQEQYKKLLEVLVRKASLSESDLLSISYYLLLQDRVDEALKHFGQITKSSDDVTKHASEFQIQYDYMAAYFDLYSENPVKAPVIAAKYVNYPVPRYFLIYLFSLCFPFAFLFFI
jgi:hypothetical protein